MPIIATRNIKPQMTLAQPVESFTGQLLLGKGAVITQNQIKNLKAWGVTEVEIVGVESAKPPCKKPKEIDPEALAEAQCRTEKLFRHANRDHPAMKEILRLATLKNLDKLTEVNIGDSANAR